MGPLVGSSPDQWGAAPEALGDVLVSDSPSKSSLAFMQMLARCYHKTREEAECICMTALDRTHSVSQQAQTPHPTSYPVPAYKYPQLLKLCWIINNIIYCCYSSWCSSLCCRNSSSVCCCCCCISSSSSSAASLNKAKLLYGVCLGKW